MQKWVRFALVLILCASGFIQAQKMWVPYFRFRCDNNQADRYFLSSEGQFAGDHRFADGTNMIAYHIDLNLFKDVQAKTPLTIRFHVWNEYLVKISDVPISSSDQGEVVAQYTNDPTWPPSNGEEVWAEIPIQQYLDLNQTDIYLSFFDGRPQDGMGPSLGELGLYYQADRSSIPNNRVNCVLSNTGLINVDGAFSEWSTLGTWTPIQKGGTNIFSTGTIADNNDLSGKAAVAFDVDDIYVGAQILDSKGIVAGDSLIFYIGDYTVTDSLNSKGHQSIKVADGSMLSGYRNRVEPDYRFVVAINEATSIINETNIVKGSVPGATVKVVKNATGYNVEAQIPYTSIYVKDSVSKIYKPDTSAYNPFAFQIKTARAALGTGLNSDIDIDPSSWAFKTNFIDKRAVNTDTLAKGYIKIITPGSNDKDYLVAKYPGSSDANHRWADNTDTIAYHFDVAKLLAAVPNQDVYIGFHIKNEYVVSYASGIDSLKTQLAVWSTKGVPCTDGSNVTDVEVSLQSMQKKGIADLYIFLTDGIPTDGWGASVDKISVYYKGVYATTNPISFIPGTGSNGDAAYLVADSGSGSNSTHRWADGNSSFGYKFDLKALKANMKPNTELFFNVNMQNEWVVSVAKSEKDNQIELERWSVKNVPVTDGSNLGYHKYSLKSYMDAGWDNVVFFFKDGVPADGWGPALYNAGIISQSIQGYYQFDQFVPSSAVTSEVNYLVTGHEGSGVGNDHRWADGGSDVCYRFNKADLLKKSNNVDDIIVTYKINNEYCVSVAQGLDSLRDTIAIWSTKGVPCTDGSNTITIATKLKPYFDLGWSDVYLFFTDGIPSDGWGPSIWNVALTTLQDVVAGVKKVSSTIPDKFNIYQNYPNPFNPETTIKYDIPVSGRISLTVYDILGREVKTLVNEVQTAGKYQVTWKGDNNFGRKVASGIYLYRINFADKMQVAKKMIMLK
jgi:hypothetical protein